MSAVKLGNLKITGDVDSEYVSLMIQDDCDLGEYQVSDDTFDESGNPTNKHRHVFLFPRTQVEQGDTVILSSNIGTYKKKPSFGDSAKSTHFFYWNLRESIWNVAGDTAHLMKVPYSGRSNLSAKK